MNATQTASNANAAERVHHIAEARAVGASPSQVVGLARIALALLAGEWMDEEKPHVLFPAPHGYYYGPFRIKTMENTDKQLPWLPDTGDLFILRIVLSDWIANHAGDPNVTNVRTLLNKIEVEKARYQRHIR